MSGGEGGEIQTLAELDAKIAELVKARDDHKHKLEDPEQRRARRIRRQQLLGRAAETWRLPEDLIQGAQSLAEDEAWLFEPEYMQPDGWTLHKGHWTLPAESRSE